MTEPSIAARLFLLQRDRDVTGVSGPGPVADGVQWADGTVVLRWRERPSTSVWDSLDLMLSVHGHDGATRVIWADDTAGRARAAAGRAYQLADRWEAAHGSAAFLVRAAGAELRDVLDDTAATDEWTRQDDGTWTLPFDGGTISAPAHFSSEDRAKFAAAWAQQRQAPADDEDAQRTTRHNSLLNLLDRIDRTRTLTPEERTLLRQHVEAEIREADTARAEAEHYQQLSAEQGQALSRATATREEQRRRADQADAVTAETKRLMERRTKTLRERAERAEAAVERVRALATGEYYGITGRAFLAALDRDTREATDSCPYCTGGPQFPRTQLGAHIEQTHGRVLAALARGVSLDELLHDPETHCRLPHEMEA